MKPVAPSEALSRTLGEGCCIVASTTRCSAAAGASCLKGPASYLDVVGLDPGTVSVNKEAAVVTLHVDWRRPVALTPIGEVVEHAVNAIAEFACRGERVPACEC